VCFVGHMGVFECDLSPFILHFTFYFILFSYIVIMLLCYYDLIFQKLK
jgi:hypothetical protein